MNRRPWFPGLPACALACALPLASCLGVDTLVLRDQVTLSGVILSEKPDRVFVDLGFTVLGVPRDHIIAIQPGAPGETGDSDASPSTQSPAETAVRQGLYREAIQPPAERPVREWVAELGESVVQVRTPSSLGSGFFIDETGHLITNFHVIEGETKLSVEVYHQKNGELERQGYRTVRIVAMNKFADLALLKVDDAGAPPFSPVLLGRVENLSVGERLFAIGSPLGLERTVTEGILSTKTRQIEGKLYLQTTAQINPGNSGGPLFNLRGEVVGVINMKLTSGEGLGFAIPVDEVRNLLRHRDAYAYDNDNPSNPFRYLPPPRRLTAGDVRPDRTGSGSPSTAPSLSHD
jgi:serine protease Do